MTSITEPKAAAKAAHLRYVMDTEPGIRRKKAGKGFSYIGLDGEIITDADERQRIEAMVIPPAWTEVWISPRPNGHILASGRDERGRKQYRYHPDWNATRNSHKFDRMQQFGKNLPVIRETVDQHLRQRKISREKVLAVVVRLLETTLIRIGNPEYARHNAHYGLTTLQDEHVLVEGQAMRFDFVGKSGKEHAITLKDRRLAKAVKACQEIEGYKLFQYYDDEGVSHALESADVNAYLREITGDDFTAKDFRTWGGSTLMIEILGAMPLCETETECKRNITQAVKAVAQKLGNTTAVCRNYYVSPVVTEAYQAGKLPDLLAKQPEPKSPFALHRHETALMALIGKK